MFVDAKLRDKFTIPHYRRQFGECQMKKVVQYSKEMPNFELPRQ